MAKSKNIKKWFESDKEIYLLSFEGKSPLITIGKFHKELYQGETLYVFNGTLPGRSMHKMSSSRDIEGSKCGHPLKIHIINGKIEFVAFFKNSESAEKSLLKISKEAVLHTVKKSVERDREKIRDLSDSIMKRLATMNRVLSSKCMSDATEAIKQFKNDSYC
jgi:hypothetical protein